NDVDLAVRQAERGRDGQDRRGDVGRTGAAGHLDLTDPESQIKYEVDGRVVRRLRADGVVDLDRGQLAGGRLEDVPRPAQEEIRPMLPVAALPRRFEDVPFLLHADPPP